MFHSANDGKGNRQVYVNGNPIKRVLWANEEQGLVCYFPYPLKINRRKANIYTRLLKGKVRVEMTDGMEGEKAD